MGGVIVGVQVKAGDSSRLLVEVRWRGVLALGDDPVERCFATKAFGE